MANNQDVHTFAVKWFDKFRDIKTLVCDVESLDFADACFALGFQMDCRKAFEATCPDTNAWTDYRDLDKIIDHVTNIMLLGSAIFSKWKYFTHGASSAETMLSFENRSWFLTALSRLERLAADDEASPFAFDGRANTDRIERIAVDYHRVTKIKPGTIPEGSTWDYGEHITIDRKTERMEHIQNIGSGCQVSRKYYVEGGISSFLDDLDAAEFLAHTEGNPPDVVINPLETKEYKITIDYLYDEPKVLTGTFDKNGLPDDFSDFAESVFYFMRFYGMGEIIDPAVHGNLLRKQTDLIFCNVEFEECGNTYCYLTDDDTFEVGDYVIVPAGKDNHEAIAQIESIEYHSAADAPFPLNKIKKILGKSGKAQEE